MSCTFFLGADEVNIIFHLLKDH